MLVLMVPFIIYEIYASIANDKITECVIPKCDENEEVCALRTEGEGFRLKLFKSECELLRVKCGVDNDSGYEIVAMDYCIHSFKINPKEPSKSTSLPCIECTYPTDFKIVCGIAKDGQGFRVRLFESECQLRKFNCENKLDFSATDTHICKGVELTGNRKDDLVKNEDSDSLIIVKNSTETVDQTITADDDAETSDIKNIIVVRSSPSDFRNINESINNFFAATHVFDLPVREVETSYLNMSTRRRQVKIVRPVKVFVPWITIPKNISDDHDHMPTLSTCYHKCPRKCPDTYAPVCGVPGIVAREPSLMFQNHCFMDVAQCKMYWEKKSPTSLSSSYVESSFLFCLGDEMNGMYRFLPLIKTLQHMGRLRKKGRFHYRFHNMKFFNNLLARQPKFMG